MRAVHLTIIILIFLSSCKSQSKDNKTKLSDSVKVIKSISIEKIVPQEQAKYKYVKSIPTIKGYERIKVKENSYASFLRNLELKTDNNTVYLYNGKPKYDQGVHFAIIKMDVGKRDLQQCADAVMRLRAEYLYSQKQYSKIHFNFLSDGKPRYFKNYANGNMSHKKFRRYMDYIFSYANTASLKKELHKVSSINEIQIGDVFIQQGKPFGHAITVMDIANNENNEIIFMLSQSYMPAQEIHILKNPNDSKMSPWYKVNNNNFELITPEWEFTYNDLRRF